MTLEPLRNKRVIRDLVTDTVPPCRKIRERLRSGRRAVPDGPAAIPPLPIPETGAAA